MADGRFFEALGPITVAEAAKIAGARMARGDDREKIVGVASVVDDALDGAVIYADSAKFLPELALKSPALCIINESLVTDCPGRFALAVSDNPRAAFGLICQRLFRSRLAGQRIRKLPADVVAHETAFVDETAVIGPGVRIGPNVSIGPGVSIGENSIIYAGAAISHALIGKGARIHSGAVIGQDGFGFEATPAGIVRMPQLGRVLIGEDVDIGANTTIDRGAIGDTIIGDSVKIDNLVQIGHNVRIGDFTVIAAQTGISGSTVIGKGVLMGGKVGVSNHITIGDGVQLAAGSGVIRDIPAGEKWGGAPAQPVKQWLREVATLAKLARKSR